MTLSVREALSTTALQYGRLVAGKTGLDNDIRWVTIVEVLEDAGRLAEGEFLITTAYGLDAEPGKKARFVESLAARRLSGVAVLTGFYLPEVTPDLIEEADKYGLPLIELPSFLNFSDITQSILHKIVHSKYDLLDFSENIHQELLQLLLSSKGFPSIAELLAERTGGSVTICDQQWQILARTKHTSIPDIQQCDRDIVDAFQSGALMKALQQREVVHFESFCDGVPIINTAVPVSANDKIYGFIILTKLLNAFTELDRISIGHAAMVCGLEFLRIKSVEEAEWRMQGDFLEEILSGKWLKVPMIVEKGRSMGYDFSKPHSIFVSKICTPIADEALMREHLRELYETAKQVFAESNIKVLPKLRHDSLVLLLEGESLSKDKLTPIVQKLRTVWKTKAPTIKTVMGIGTPRTVIDQLAKCADEADMALNFGQSLNLCDQVCFYEDLGIFHWLIKLHEAKVDLKSMAEKVLGNLIEYDRKHGSRLLETLETYLTLNQNMQQTASALFIHRHSLKYRLSRIEAKTGLSLKDYNHRTQLQLAIYIHKFLQALES
ncbi:MAG: PucR family transcriptional regulator [Bacillota bacterium]